MLCVASGVAGAVTLLVASAVTPRPWGDPALFALFTVALCALHSMPLRLTHDGDLEGMQLEEALFVPMALLLSPAETLAAFVVSEAFGHAWRRRGGLKAMFNVGQIVTCAGAGLAVSRLLGARTAHFDGRAVTGAVAGGLAFPALTAMAVAGIIAVSQRASFRTVLFDGVATRVAMWGGSVSLGVVVLLATEHARWAVALIIVPVVVVQIAYAGARAQWRERQRVEALYEAAASIRSSIDPVQVRAHLVAEATRHLEAASARVVPAHQPLDPTAICADLDGSTVLEVAGRAGGGSWDDGDRAMVRALAGVAAGALQNASLFDQVGVERTKLADVLASTSDGILTVDGDDRVVSWNPAMVRITGHDESAALGSRPADLLGVVPADEPATAAPSEGGDASFGGGNQPQVVRIRTASGSERWLTVTRSPLPRGGAVIVARDETAKKEIDDLKADFLATISHELRTPLTPIKGYLAMMLDDPEMDPARMRAFVEVMARQAGRLERLIGDLLDATSLQQDELYVRVPVDWPGVVAGVAEVMRTQFTDHDIVVADVDNGAPLPAVLADAHRAEQVLSNLVINACKYSPSGSTVTIVVRADDEFVRTSVIDQGPGIAPADRERIFERFTRLGDHMRRTVGGAGLGLFIAKQLVAAMHGTISVDDAPGGGSSFTFTLPTAPSPAAPPPAPVVHAAP